MNRSTPIISALLLLLTAYSSGAAPIEEGYPEPMLEEEIAAEEASGEDLSPRERVDSVFFAPYDGPFPVSLEARFDGFLVHHPNYREHAHFLSPILSNSFAFNGYVKLPRYFLFKIGTVIGGAAGCIRRVGIDLQGGKYWPEYGAVRFGLFAGDIGVGGDYWVIYRNRFKWLTTVEVAAFCDHNFLFFRYSFSPSVKWLNRFFVTGTFFISCGVEHIHGLRGCASVTQGFLGFGSTI